jgi:hypothetical protein
MHLSPHSKRRRHRAATSARQPHSTCQAGSCWKSVASKPLRDFRVGQFKSFWAWIPRPAKFGRSNIAKTATQKPKVCIASRALVSLSFVFHRVGVHVAARRRNTRLVDSSGQRRPWRSTTLSASTPLLHVVNANPNISPDTMAEPNRLYI